MTDELVPLRARIDQLDAILVHTLAERFRQTEKVGRIKARHDLPPLDPEREEAQRQRLSDLAARTGLDPDFARRLHALITDEVKRNHARLSGEH